MLHSIPFPSVTRPPISNADLGEVVTSGPHDLPLPPWGPYSNTWHGISHIADLTAGLRMDLVVVPGRFRRGLRIPNVRFESGYSPMAANPELTSHNWRYDLGENLEMDMLCHAITASSCRLRFTFRNHGTSADTAVLHLLPNLQYPELPDGNINGETAVFTLSLPSGAIWVNAEQYTKMHYAKPDHRDYLPFDGYRPGVIRAGGLVCGRGIGKSISGTFRPFGVDSDDRLKYVLDLQKPIDNAWIGIRACCDQNGTNGIRISGDLGCGQAEISQKKMQLHWIELGTLQAGTHCIFIHSKGGAPITIDGFVLVEHSQREQVKFSPQDRVFQPQVTDGPIPSSRLLDWSECPSVYGIAWNYPDWQWRNLKSGELDYFLPRICHNHISDTLKGTQPGWFGNAFLRPIIVDPGTDKVIDAFICNGSKSEVERQLSAWASLLAEDLAQTAATADASHWRPAKRAAGVERLAATTMTNVLFPLQTRGRYIRNATPGKNWNSLYTWDAGFIALGLSEINIDLSRSCIDSYLCGPEDEDCAFIHHGSLVPVQFWAAKALFDRTQSRELAAHLFPGLRKMHDVFMGRWKGSTMNRLQSGLLSPWDYSYNSGGWDDYPPQQWLTRHTQLRSQVTPVVTTAQALRSARILKQIACWLDQDSSIFSQDEAQLSSALENHAWNESEGIYSYVVHDTAGNPDSFLKHPETGTDFNLGLDGLTPLTSGCRPDRAQRLFSALSDRRRFITPIGLSTVDQCAPYYRHDGYWNGAVWLPHQYFFWRACLDWGQTELAWEIASTALQLWEHEVSISGYCFEHFLIASGRGVGWHHFSGLSTPILLWHAAYYETKRLTVGSDVWIKQQNWGADGSLDAELYIDGHREGYCAVLISKASSNCRITWNGEAVKFQTQGDALVVLLPRLQQNGRLRMTL